MRLCADQFLTDATEFFGDNGQPINDPLFDVWF